MKNKNKHLTKIVLILIIVSLILTYLFVPNVKNTINNIMAVLTSADVNKVVEYIRSFGVYAYLVSFLLMIFQSVAAPIPAFLITFANAIVFGW